MIDGLSDVFEVLCQCCNNLVRFSTNSQRQGWTINAVRRAALGVG